MFNRVTRTGLLFLLLGLAPPVVAQQDLFDRYYKEAEAFYSKHEFDAAAKKLDRAIMYAPHRYEGYYKRGKALSEGGHPLESLKDFKKAIEFQPKAELASIYSSRAVAYVRLKQPDMAIKDNLKALQYDPKHFKALVRLVILYDEKGQYQKAIDICNKAIERKVDLNEFYRSRAKLHAKLQNKPQALVDIEKALNAEPNNTATIYARAKIYADFKDFDNAIKDLHTVIKLKPKASMYQTTLGAVLILAGKYEEALAVLDKSIALNNESGSAHNNRGVVLEKMGRKTEAKKEFDLAVKYDTENAAYYANHARLAVAMGDVDDVVDDFVGIDETSERLPQADPSRDSFDVVIRQFDKVIKLNPSDADNYYNRGIMYFAQGDFVSADRDLSTFLKKSKAKGDAAIFALALRSIVLTRLHKKTEAQQLLTTSAGEFEKDDWTKAFRKYLTGEAPQQELLRATQSRKNNETARCFIGLKLLADGNKDAAKEPLTWVKNNCNPNYDEYLLASSALSRIEAKPKDKKSGGQKQKVSDQKNLEKLKEPLLIIK